MKYEAADLKHLGYLNTDSGDLRDYEGDVCRGFKVTYCCYEPCSGSSTVNKGKPVHLGPEFLSICPRCDRKDGIFHDVQPVTKRAKFQEALAKRPAYVRKPAFKTTGIVTVVMRHRNGKYYDKTVAKYVNLSDVRARFNRGEPMVIRCAVTKNDITKDTIEPIKLSQWVIYKAA